jgi:DNA-binding transcriptional MerR regulator
MLRIGEVAQMTGVTPRLLRHYEAVGVLRPAETNPRTGYRYYTRAQVATLQRVLGYREAGVPLALIAAVMRGDEPRELLERQRDALVAERVALDRKLALLDEEIARRAMRPFRVKRTAPVWAASVRQSVETYAAADELMRDLRARFAVDDATRSAAIWHCCRPDEGRIDCEMQVMFPHARVGLRMIPSQLVVSFAHTGPDAELPAIYQEMKRWASAARYRYCGPLREVYWEGVTEVQFPVQAA